MKKLLFSIICILSIYSTSFAQVPAEGINYQAVARDTSQMPLANVNLAVKFTIFNNSSGVITTIFSETQDPVSTNVYGLFTTVIGKIDTSEFENINWTTGEKSLEVEIAASGSTAFVSMGVNKLMSVPYALYAKHSANSWNLSGNTGTGANFLGTLDTHSLTIKTNNTERIKVLSNGNVGIGTPLPNGRLDVKGISNTSFTYGFGVRNSQNLYTLVVRDDNKVGIGTTSPLGKLQVHYDTTINFTTGPGLNGYGTIHIVPDKNIAGNSMGITFGTPDEFLSGPRSTVQAGIYVQGAGAYGTKMYFATTNDFNTSGAKTRMMIDNTGNVGIGTISPGTSLEVNGGNTFSPKYVILGGNGPVIPGNTSYLRMNSPADVTITNLGSGQKIGQTLILENANGNSGGKIKLTDGNGVNLSSPFYNMDPSHTLTLIWNGTIWLETARSLN